MMDATAAASPTFMDGPTSPLQNHHMKPSIELNTNMSLLSSPLDMRNTINDNDDHDNETIHQHDDDKSISSNTPDATTQTSHEDLLKQASTWVRVLETVRDELRIMSVRNAILLDSLAMAGATGDDDDTHLE